MSTSSDRRETDVYEENPRFVTSGRGSMLPEHTRMFSMGNIHFVGVSVTHIELEVVVRYESFVGRVKSPSPRSREIKSNY